LTTPQRLSPGAIALVGVVAFGWGLNFGAIKLSLAEIPLLTFRAGSCLAAGVVMIALARALGLVIWPARAEWRRFIIAALLNVTAWQVLVAGAILFLASGQVAVLSFTMPLWTAVLGVAFFGERLNARVVVAVALGTAGILVLVARDLAAIGASPWGVALSIAATLAWAGATLYQKRHAWTTSTLAFAGWQLLIGGIPIAILAPFVDGFWFGPASATTWLAAGYVTLVALVACYAAWFKLVRIVPASIAAIGSLAVPVVALITGALALDEPFGAAEAASIVLIGAALALVTLKPRPS
jgi:drug/metabolite transporter (DMT)-like permease